MIEFFDLFENRGSGRLPPNPPEEFMSPASLRDVDTNRYLIIDSEMDVSDGNLGGLSLTPGATQIDSRDTQGTGEKSLDYDPTDPSPSIRASFGTAAAEAARKAAEAAADAERAKSVAAAIAAAAADRAAGVITDINDIPLVGLTEDQPPSPLLEDRQYPPRSPLSSIWFLGAVGVAAYLIFGGKK